ncbi:MAG: hypothetical protein Q9226_004408, partial [Calogaya cf. arnoldii]
PRAVIAYDHPVSIGVRSGSMTSIVWVPLSQGVANPLMSRSLAYFRPRVTPPTAFAATMPLSTVLTRHSAVPLQYNFESISSLSDAVDHYRGLKESQRSNALRNPGSEPVAVAVSMAILDLIMHFLPHDRSHNATATSNKGNFLAGVSDTTRDYCHLS